MNHYFNYKDNKDKISLIQVVHELGYKYDKGSSGERKKSTPQVPSFILTDSNNKEIDRIYIFNPNDNEKANFYRRSPGPGQKKGGDVFTLILENIHMFPERANAINDVDARNLVCMRLLNVEPDKNKIFGENAAANVNRPPREFNLADFDREKGNWQKAMRYFKERGIDRHIAELFKDNLEMVKDTKAETKVDWHNLGFPYRRPGEAEIVGYEIRGFGKFRSKAEGTDSTRACWQAYLGKQGAPDRIPSYAIEELHIAESAYDVMSYVQLHMGKLDFEKCLFISVGGSISNELLVRLYKEYPTAVPVLHFDNDPTGVMYDIRAAAVKMGKTLRSTPLGDCVRFNLDDKVFTVPSDKLSYNQFIQAAGIAANARPNIRIEKAPGEFKDWNEILQAAMEAEKTQKKPVFTGKRSGTPSNPAPNPEDEDTRGIKR